MKKRYEINPIKQSTIDKINKLKTLLGFSKSGLLIEFLVNDYIKNNKEKLKKSIDNFFD